MSPSSLPAPEQAGRLKRNFIRYGLRFLISCYLRVRLERLALLPAGPPYLLNFSHPNWVDPMLLAAFWPKHHRLLIFGPREENMTSGWRNRVISWTHLAVPFKPSKSDLLDTTRRATGALKAGFVLAIAGEGRLSDREGAIVPLEDGAAFLALRAGVPIVPLAVIGTRWLHFGKRVTLRVGPAVPLGGLRADREGVALLTARLQAAMEELLVGVSETPPPGRFGRWVTDVFNERPWLNEVSPTAPDDAREQAGRGARR